MSRPLGSLHLQFSGTTLCVSVFFLLATSLPKESLYAQKQIVPPDFRLQDVSSETGIVWEHTTGKSGLGYLVEGVATGLASFDYDLDGLVDIYFLNGRRLKDPGSDSGKGNAFYRNLGEFRFADVTEASSTSEITFGLGAVVADYNEDGFPDLYLSNFGKNRLFMNAGDGTFIDATEVSGTGNGSKFGGGAAFCDFNGDGVLDLYVGNYVDFTVANAVIVNRNGKIFHAGPTYYKSVPDTLYFGTGDGRFLDASVESGIAKFAGPTMGLIAADLNGDGYPDIYTCNDGKANFLFINDGQGCFTEEALIAGVAFDFRGTANASMGVDIGDYDGDGLLDLITTNYQNEIPVLYRNLGDGVFEDASTSARVAEAIIPHVTWGTSLVDFDNDGQLDLFVAAGHFDDAEITDDRTAKKVRDFLMMNRAGKFEDVSSLVGLAAVESSRGVVFEDFDNDGDIDIVVLNSNATPTFYRNDAVQRNDSLTAGAHVKLKLVDTVGNRNAIGARVHVQHSVLTKDFVVLSGRGYQSHYGEWLHIGLNQVTSPTVLATVVWPDGTTATYDLVPNSFNVLIREQGGSVMPLAPIRQESKAR
ncbi:CRTAC1 family protein [Pirellulaceae bacterium SH449]